MVALRELGIDPDVTHRVVQYSVQAMLTFDAMCGIDVAALAEVDTLSAETVREAAGLDERQRAVVGAPVGARGLGVRAVGAVRDDHVILSGVAVLQTTPAAAPLWARGATSTAPFWREFRAALARHAAAAPELQIRVVWAGQEVWKGPEAGGVLVPGRLAREDVMDAGRTAREVVAAGAAVDWQVGAHVGPSVTAAAMAALPVGRLQGREYRALARLHTHAVEREVLQWGGAGAECRLCGREAYAGHHRVCTSRPRGALTRAHGAVQRALAAFINATPGWSAACEQAAGVREDGTWVRSDVEIGTPQGGVFIVEVKTWDPRCQSWRDKKAVKAEAKLKKKGEDQYRKGTAPRVFVLGVDGTLGTAARHFLNELQEARADAGTRDGRDDVPSLRAQLGCALARAEAESYEGWAHEVARLAPLVDAAAPAAAVAAAAAADGEPLGEAAAAAVDGAAGAVGVQQAEVNQSSPSADAS